MASTSLRAVLFGIRTKFSNVRHLSCTQVYDMIKLRGHELILLDTRSPEEYGVSYVAGAKNVDFDHRNTKELASQFDPSMPIVCYCAVGYRSSVVAQELASHYASKGIQETKVYSMEGGIFKWAIENKPLVRWAGEEEGEVEASTVHPFSNMWGKMLPSHMRGSPKM